MDLGVAGTVALGVVGLQDRVYWWDCMGVQPRPLPNAAGKSTRDWSYKSLAV